MLSGTPLTKNGVVILSYAVACLYLSKFASILFAFETVIGKSQIIIDAS